MKLLLIMLFCGLSLPLISQEKYINNYQEDCYLDIYGKIKDTKSASVEVFTYDESQNIWVSIWRIRKAKQFDVRLNPKQKHFIQFVDMNGTLKKIHIEAGGCIELEQNIDIDFGNQDSYVIYQNLKREYEISTIK